MNVLMTGGSGFVGLNVVERLLTRGDRVVVFGLAPPPDSALGAFATLPGGLSVVEGDIRDGAALDRAFAGQEIEAVVHGAVITAGKDRAREDARTIVAVNVLGTVEALEAARRRRVRRFIYLSSGSVYGRGGFAAAELGEETPAAVPDTLYGITKYASERTTLCYRSLWGLDAVAARLGSVFGRWEYSTGLRDTLSAPLLVTRLAAAGREAILPRPGRRDWIYAPDVAAGIIALLDLEAPKYDVYNVGSGTEWTIEDWCRKLKEAFPKFAYRLAAEPGEANVSFFTDRDRAPLSIARLREDTDFVPRYGLDEAAADYLDWIGRHRLWRQ